MRVLISADMEGIAGVVGYDDTVPGRPDYERARELLTDEVSAAVRGVRAFDASAEALVSEGHAAGRNILPERLDRGARLLRGFPKGGGMLSGVDGAVDAVLLVGYHGKAGTWRSVLAHTMNGSVIQDVRCDGRSLGEIGLNIAYAAAHGAATVLISGDDTACAEAEEVAPGIKAVAVKRALGGWAADCLHPAEARDRIEAAVPAALAARDSVHQLCFDGPVDLELDLVRPVMVEPFQQIPGVERNGDRGLRYRAPDFQTAYGIVEFVAVFGLTGT
jgi:D-amino peptidase